MFPRHWWGLFDENKVGKCKKVACEDYRKE